MLIAPIRVAVTVSNGSCGLTRPRGFTYRPRPASH
jgi:hypothetical protein